MNSADKPNRRWLRFSLRTLLLAMLVLAVLLGWTVHKAREQGVAVAALTKLGCQLNYRDSGIEPPTVLERVRALLREPEPRSVHQVTADSKLNDAGMVHLRGLTGLRSFHVIDAEISDAGLRHVRGQTQLEWLALSGTKVTDAGLLHLRGMTELEYLFLEDTAVTDAGLAHLRDLTKIRWLFLSGTKVTDAGLVYLGGMQFVSLGLAGTLVTDDGLAQLRGRTLRGTTYLDLRDTQISDSGLAQLRTITPLDTLCLQRTQVTDAGLMQLRGLNQLKELRLDETRVTDAGLLHLEGLTRLKSVSVIGTQVTDEGVQKLWKALPNCDIVHEANQPSPRVIVGKLHDADAILKAGFDVDRVLSMLHLDRPTYDKWRSKYGSPSVEVAKP